MQKKWQNIPKFQHDPIYGHFGHVYLNILKSYLVLFCLLKSIIVKNIAQEFCLVLCSPNILYLLALKYDT